MRAPCSRRMQFLLVKLLYNHHLRVAEQHNDDTFYQLLLVHGGVTIFFLYFHVALGAGTQLRIAQTCNVNVIFENAKCGALLM